MSAGSSGHIQQLNRGALANTVGTIARFGLGILSFPILIRVLGVARFGDWVLVQSFGSVLGLLEFGLSSALSVRISANTAVSRLSAASASVDAAGAMLAMLGLLGAVLMVGLGFLGPAWWPGEPVPGPVWLACFTAAPGVLFRMLQLWLLGIEAGLGDYALQARIETASMLLTTAGIITLALFGLDLVWLAAWGSFSALATCAGHWFALSSRHGLRFTGQFPRHDSRALLSFGWKHWLANLGGMLFTRGDRLVVFGLLGREAAGTYAAAVSIVSRINEFAAIPVQPIVPNLAQARAREDGTAVELFRLTMDRSFSFSILLGVSVMAAGPLLSVVYVASAAPEFGSVLCVMAAAYALFAGANGGHYSNLALQRPGRNAAMTLVGGGSALVAIALGARADDLRWAAAGNGLYGVVLALNFFAGRELGVSWPELWFRHARFIAVLALALGAGLAVAGAQGLVTSVGLAVVGGLFAIGCAAWLDPSDARLVLRWIRALARR